MGPSAEHVPERMSSQKLELIITKLQKESEDFQRQLYQELSETDRTTADQLLQRSYYRDLEAARKLDPARVKQMEELEDFHRQQYQRLLETNKQDADTYLKKLYDKNPRLAWEIDPERVEQMGLAWK